MATTVDNNRAARTGSILSILAGIWLIISPYIIRFSSVSNATRNDIIVGVLVLILALIGMANARMVWTRWLNVLLGIWTFFSPFLLGFSSTTNALWNNMILGVLVVIFAGWSAGSIAKYQKPEAM